MFLNQNVYWEETFSAFPSALFEMKTGGVGGLFHLVTETTAKMLSELWEEADGQITAGPLPLVCGDQAQLSPEFQNLVSNSLRNRR
jgi:hypothetical protein